MLPLRLIMPCWSPQALPAEWPGRGKPGLADNPRLILAASAF
jgi:hypothetical protein